MSEGDKPLDMNAGWTDKVQSFSEPPDRPSIFAILGLLGGIAAIGILMVGTVVYLAVAVRGRGDDKPVTERKTVVDAETDDQRQQTDAKERETKARQRELAAEAERAAHAKRAAEESLLAAADAKHQKQKEDQATIRRYHGFQKRLDSLATIQAAAFKLIQQNVNNPDASLLFDRRYSEGLSWQVHLLRKLGAGNLYDKFHLYEPWDSPHNKALLSEMPSVFGERNAEGTTRIRSLLRLDGQIESRTRIADIKDGLDQRGCPRYAQSSCSRRGDCPAFYWSASMTIRSRIPDLLMI